MSFLIGLKDNTPRALGSCVNTLGKGTIKTVVIALILGGMCQNITQEQALQYIKANKVKQYEQQLYREKRKKSGYSSPQDTLELQKVSEYAESGITEIREQIGAYRGFVLLRYSEGVPDKSGAILEQTGGIPDKRSAKVKQIEDYQGFVLLRYTGGTDIVKLTTHKDVLAYCTEDEVFKE